MEQLWNEAFLHKETTSYYRLLTLFIEPRTFQPQAKGSGLNPMFGVVPFNLRLSLAGWMNGCDALLNGCGALGTVASL